MAGRADLNDFKSQMLLYRALLNRSTLCSCPVLHQVYVLENACRLHKNELPAPNHYLPTPETATLERRCVLRFRAWYAMLRKVHFPNENASLARNRRDVTHSCFCDLKYCLYLSHGFVHRVALSVCPTMSFWTRC